jgi:hypothetical protein
LATSCIGTAIYNTILRERVEGLEDEEEDVSSYWMILRKQNDTGN